MEANENNTPVFIALLMILFLLIAMNLGNVHLQYGTVIAPNQQSNTMPDGPGVRYANGTQIVIAIEFVIIGIGILGIILLSIKYGKKFILDLLLKLVISIIMAVGLGLLIAFLVSKSTKKSGNGSSSIAINVVPGAVLFYVAISAFMLIIAYLIVKSINPKKKEKYKKEDVSKYVNRAINTIKIGKDVRGAILRAYVEMEKMMHVRGVQDKKYFTPREFRDFALNNLKLSPEPVDTLVSLFELARYSEHSMDESQRDKALESLEMIRNELQNHPD